jgi:hypothetical protein
MPELLAIFPEAPVINRPSPISAFDDPNFVEAVKRTGRKKLIMAGVTTDVCLMFPVQQALAMGYEVYAVYDASGFWDPMSELVSSRGGRLQGVLLIVRQKPVERQVIGEDWQRPLGWFRQSA